MRYCAMTGCLLSMLLAPALGGAQSKDDDSAAARSSGKVEAKPTSTAPVGAYQGVTIDGGEPPVIKAPPAGYQYLLWPGFHIRGGQAEVFLQLTGPITYERKDRGRMVTITMDRIQVLLKNNLRPVIARHFPSSPVDSFRLRPLPKKEQLRLEIKLKRRNVKPVVTAKAVGPYTYLVISMPTLPTR